MSTDIATSERVDLQKSRGVEGVPVKFQPVVEDLGSLAWRQVNEILNSSLSGSGFPQPPETTIKGWHIPTELPIPILVAPGIVVGIDEYEQRYGDIDLEKFRQEMSPELFKVFVRHIGRIPGTTDLNLGDIITTPE